MFKKKATSEALKNEIVAAVAAQTPEQMSREARYRPHAATWLGNDGFNDPPEAPQRAAAPEYKRNLM